MINFKYYAPTKVVFGKDTVSQVGSLAKEFGATKALIHYGVGSVVKSGLLDMVKASLTESGISFVLLGGVKPNPRLSLVREGIELAKKKDIDFVLAVGGGSVIDSAKAIAFGMRIDFDVWDLYTGKAVATTCAPIGTILTISAAGSEMSNGTVITNEEGWLKRAYGSDLCRPKFSILDPELTFTLPAYQTSCGAADIMMHTMERYFTTEKAMEITDIIAESLLKTVMKNVKKALANPTDYNSRAELMWSSSLSHNDLTGCGGIGDWSTHDTEHELGGMFDVAHGAGLAAVWSSWARYVLNVDVSRFAKFASNVFDIHLDTEKETALAGIKAMEEFYNSINMPKNINELGINLTDEQIEELAEKATNGNTSTLGNFKKLNKDDIKSILTMAR